MQQDRGSAPYPIGLEVALLSVCSVFCLMVLGVHTGRAVATVLAGGAWVWPVPQQLLVSVPAVLGGDPTAGLPAGLSSGSHGAGPALGLLHWSVVVVELVLLAVTGWGGVAALQRWGPARMKGVASRDEAEAVLGVSRLRKVRAIVRPDLYGTTATIDTTSTATTAGSVSLRKRS